MMDDFTFGSSDAAITLAAMLSRYESNLTNRKVAKLISRKASKIYHTTNDLFLDVQLCKHRIRLMKLVLTAQSETVYNSDLPVEVKTFLLNCIKAQHRKYLKNLK